MNQKSIHIVIVESSHIIYEGLFKILSNTGQHFNIHFAYNLNEMHLLILKLKVDIILINPGFIQHVTKDIQALKKEPYSPQLIGIIYTFIDKEILSLFDGFIYINDSPNEIISIIQKLLYSDQQTSNQSMQQSNLSEREIDVLKLLVTGNANKEIADKLYISTNTVISHRKNISQKTGIKSVSGLTIYAVLNKIISVDNYQE